METTKKARTNNKSQKNNNANVNVEAKVELQLTEVVVTVETTPEVAVTAQQVRKMTKQQLFETAKVLNIETVHNNEERKKLHVLEDVLAQLREKAHEKSLFKPTEEMQAVLDNAEITKSDKMRQLDDLGVSMTQIAQALDAHYSFVHTQITKYRYQKSK